MTPALSTVLERPLDEHRAYATYAAWRAGGDLATRNVCVEEALPLVGLAFRAHIRALYRRHRVEDDGDAIAGGIDRLCRCIARRHFVCTRCGEAEPRHYTMFLQHHVRVAMRRQFYLSGRQVYDFGASGEGLPVGRVRTHADVNNYLTLVHLDRTIMRRATPKIRFTGSERVRIITLMEQIVQGSMPVGHEDKLSKFLVDYSYILVMNEMYLLRSSGDLIDRELSGHLTEATYAPN